MYQVLPHLAGGIVKTTESNTNSQEFLIDLPLEKGLRRNIHKVRMEQDGVQNKFRVTLHRETCSMDWAWKDQVLTEAKDVPRDIAQAYYDSLCRSAREIPGGTNPTERATRRPEGITDPTDRKYVAANMVVVSVSGRNAGRCYNISDTIYRRADGGRIAAEDLRALNHWPSGQVHVVTGQVGDETASVHSEIDSSD